MRYLIQWMFPKMCLCKCLRPNRRERIIEKCRKGYINEIDIVEHIMQFRAVKAEFEKVQGKDHISRSMQARTKTIALDTVSSSENSDIYSHASEDAQGTERKGTDRKLVKV